MHTNSTARWFITQALIACNEAPHDYFVAAIAEELHDTHGTWDMSTVHHDDFWPVVELYYAGDDAFICVFA